MGNFTFVGKVGKISWERIVDFWKRENFDYFGEKNAQVFFTFGDKMLRFGGNLVPWSFMISFLDWKAKTWKIRKNGKCFKVRN